MSQPAGSATLRCLMFEVRKLLGRRLPIVILACSILSVLGGMWLETGALEPATGYSLYAALLERALPLAAFLVMIMSTLSVNEEIATGSLRAVLLRPVSKVNVLTAKLILNMGFAIFMATLILGTSWLCVALTTEFNAILIEVPGLEPTIVFSKEAMAGISWKLSLAMIAPLMASASFGTLISVLIESEGTSVAIGTFLFLAMQAMAPLAQDFAVFLFPAHLELPIALLSELAGQDQSRQATVDAWGPWSAGYLAPFGLSLLFAIVGLVIFNKKEVAC